MLDNRRTTAYREPALSKALRVLGGVMAGVYFFTNVAFANVSDTSFWARRRSETQRLAQKTAYSLVTTRADTLAAQFPTLLKPGPSLSKTITESVPKAFLDDHQDLMAALSTTYGTLRKVLLPPKPSARGPVVIHIQDVHMNAEAQWNIRQTVEGLLKSGKISLMALEGSSEDIDLQPFVDFPRRQAVELTADYLLKENKISGPIHAALTAQGKLPHILGIEDPTHYAANVWAYKDSAQKLEETRRVVSAIESEIEGLKKLAFSPALITFDQTVTGYRTGKVPVGDYVRSMAGIINGRENRSRHAIDSFLQALKVESILDFKQVEMERSHLIEKLTLMLNATEINTLLAQSLAYRSGQLRYADFYSLLKGTCRSKGIPLSNYPAMDEYIRYVLLADGIDAEKLLTEIASLEKDAYNRLAITPEEIELVARSRYAWLTGKLVDFSLSPIEWKEYEAKSLSHPTLDLGSFESFYREANARDSAMADNLLKAIEAHSGMTRFRSPVALLVTGGFHAEGMARRLTQQGATVISYVPKIEKIDTAQGSAYLSVFTQEKTPLEKLFQGEKLFLASPAISTTVRKSLLPAILTMSVVFLAGTINGIDPQTIYTTLGGLGVLAISSAARDIVRAQIHGNGRQVETIATYKDGRLSKFEQSIRKNKTVWKTTSDFVKRYFNKTRRLKLKQMAKESTYVLAILASMIWAWGADPVTNAYGLSMALLASVGIDLTANQIFSDTASDNEKTDGSDKGSSAVLVGQRKAVLKALGLEGRRWDEVASTIFIRPEVQYRAGEYPRFKDTMGNNPHWVFEFEYNGKIATGGADDARSLFPDKVLEINRALKRKQESVRREQKKAELARDILAGLNWNEPMAKVEKLLDRAGYSGEYFLNEDRATNFLIILDEIQTRWGNFLPDSLSVKRDQTVSFDRFIEIIEDLKEVTSRKGTPPGLLSSDELSILRFQTMLNSLTQQKVSQFVAIHTKLMDYQKSLVIASLGDPKSMAQQIPEARWPETPVHQSMQRIVTWLRGNLGERTARVFVFPGHAGMVRNVFQDEHYLEETIITQKDLTRIEEGETQLLNPWGTFDVALSVMGFDRPMIPADVRNGLMTLTKLLANPFTDDGGHPTGKTPLLILSSPEHFPIAGTPFEAALVNSGYKIIVSQNSATLGLSEEGRKLVENKYGRPMAEMLSQVFSKPFHWAVYEKRKTSEEIAASLLNHSDSHFKVPEGIPRTSENENGATPNWATRLNTDRLRVPEVLLELEKNGFKSNGQALISRNQLKNDGVAEIFGPLSESLELVPERNRKKVTQILNSWESGAEYFAKKDIAYILRILLRVGRLGSGPNNRPLSAQGQASRGRTLDPTGERAYLKAVDQLRQAKEDPTRFAGSVLEQMNQDKHSPLDPLSVHNSANWPSATIEIPPPQLITEQEFLTSVRERMRRILQNKELSISENISRLILLLMNPRAKNVYERIRNIEKEIPEDDYLQAINDFAKSLDLEQEVVEKALLSFYPRTDRKIKSELGEYLYTKARLFNWGIPTLTQEIKKVLLREIFSSPLKKIGAIIELVNEFDLFINAFWIYNAFSKPLPECPLYLDGTPQFPRNSVYRWIVGPRGLPFAMLNKYMAIPNPYAPEKRVINITRKLPPYSLERNSLVLEVPDFIKARLFILNIDSPYDGNSVTIKILASNKIVGKMHIRQLGEKFETTVEWEDPFGTWVPGKLADMQEAVMKALNEQKNVWLPIENARVSKEDGLEKIRGVYLGPSTFLPLPEQSMDQIVRLRPINDDFVVVEGLWEFPLAKNPKVVLKRVGGDWKKVPEEAGRVILGNRHPILPSTNSPDLHNKYGAFISKYTEIINQLEESEKDHEELKNQIINLVMETELLLLGHMVTRWLKIDEESNNDGIIISIASSVLLLASLDIVENQVEHFPIKDKQFIARKITEAFSYLKEDQASLPTIGTTETHPPHGTAPKATGWFGLGVAYGVGMIVGMAAWVGKRVGPDQGTEVGGTSIRQFAKNFVSDGARRAAIAEDVINAFVGLSAGLLAGRVDVMAWLGLGALSPPAMAAVIFITVAIWFVVFVGSHMVARERFEKISGQQPNPEKALHLFRFYLAPIVFQTLLGFLVSSHALPFAVLVGLFILLAAVFFPWVRERHDEINRDETRPFVETLSEIITDFLRTIYKIVSAGLKSKKNPHKGTIIPAGSSLDRGKKSHLFSLLPVDTNKVVFLISAGGRGTRLWPLSIGDTPKQFARILSSEKTMLELMIESLPSWASKDRVVIAVAHGQEEIVQKLLPTFPIANIIVEPAERNTSPSSGYSTLFVKKMFGEDSTIVALPSDIYVDNLPKFHEALLDAVRTAQNGNFIVSVGVPAIEPNVNYGYMEKGAPLLEMGNRVFEGIGYREKPERYTAMNYVRSGRFDWNAGIFAWETNTFLEAFQRYDPSNFGVLMEIDNAWNNPLMHERLYSRMTSVAVDYAIMEKLSPLTPIKNAFVSGTFGWDDIGNFPALIRRRGLKVDSNGNQINGRALIQNSSDNVVLNDGNYIVHLNGIRGIGVVINSTGDILLTDTSLGWPVRDLLKCPINNNVKISSDEGIPVPLSIDFNGNHTRAFTRLLSVNGSRFYSDSDAMIGAMNIRNVVVRVSGRDIYIYGLKEDQELERMLGPPSENEDSTVSTRQAEENDLYVSVEEDYRSMSDRAAREIVADLKDIVNKKGRAVVSFSSGETPKMVYEFLRCNYRDSLDWSKIVFFQMDEYEGLSQSHPQLYSTFLLENLIRPLGISQYHLMVPKADGTPFDVRAYENLLESVGGIDLILHGIGSNGHLGFNEPGSDFESGARSVELAASTRENNSRFFSDGDMVPERGLTLGLGTFRKAEKTYLLASGVGKRNAVQQTIFSYETPNIPSSIFKTMKNVRIILDRSAVGWITLAPTHLEKGKQIDQDRKAQAEVWNPYYINFQTDDAIRERMNITLERWAFKHYVALRKIIGNRLNKPGVNVLDATTGTGRFALRIASDFDNASVTGVDILPKAIEVAQRGASLLNIKNVTFITGDALLLEETLKGNRGGFDVVFTIGLAQFLNSEDLKALARSCLRMTKPGGLVVISFPNGGSLVYRLWKKIAGKNIEKRYGLERSVHRKEIFRVLRELGLENISVEGSDPLYGISKKKLGYVNDRGEIIPYPWSGFAGGIVSFLNLFVDGIDRMTGGWLSRRIGFDLLVSATVPEEMKAEPAQKSDSNNFKERDNEISFKPQLMESSGGANSLWGTKTADYIGSLLNGERGRARLGNFYRDWAAMIEWASALKISVWKSFAIAVIYGSLIAFTPALLGHVRGETLVENGEQWVAGLWTGAFVIHHIFDGKNTPSKEGKQAAMLLIKSMGSVQGMFNSLMPSVEPGLAEKSAGESPLTEDFVTAMSARLKNDPTFRDGFIKQLMGARELTGTQRYWVSAFVAAAIGQPVGMMIFAENVEELDFVEVILGQSESGEEKKVELALVVSSEKAKDMERELSRATEKGVAVFKVDLEAGGYTTANLTNLEKAMGSWLTYASGAVVAAIGNSVQMGPAAVEGLDPSSRLKAPLLNVVGLGQMVEHIFRWIQAISSNA